MIVLFFHHASLCCWFFLLYMVLLSTMLCYYVGSNKRKVNDMKTRILLIGLLLASATVSVLVIYGLLRLVGVV